MSTNGFHLDLQVIVIFTVDCTFSNEYMKKNYLFQPTRQSSTKTDIFWSKCECIPLYIKLLSSVRKHLLICLYTYIFKFYKYIIVRTLLGKIQYMNSSHYSLFLIRVTCYFLSQQCTFVCCSLENLICALCAKTQRLFLLAFSLLQDPRGG